MRIDLRIKRKKEYWFAWFPVKTNDNTYAWFEKVIRTPIYADGYFMYYSYDYLTNK